MGIGGWNWEELGGSCVALVPKERQVVSVTVKISRKMGFPEYFAHSARDVDPGTQKSIVKMFRGRPQWAIQYQQSQHIGVQA